jgi:hypothetical protein
LAIGGLIIYCRGLATLFNNFPPPFVFANDHRMDLGKRLAPTFFEGNWKWSVLRFQFKVLFKMKLINMIKGGFGCKSVKDYLLTALWGCYKMPSEIDGRAHLRQRRNIILNDQIKQCPKDSIFILRQPCAFWYFWLWSQWLRSVGWNLRGDFFLPKREKW